MQNKTEESSQELMARLAKNVENISTPSDIEAAIETSLHDTSTPARNEARIALRVMVSHQINTLSLSENSIATMHNTLDQSLTSTMDVEEKTEFDATSGVVNTILNTFKAINGIGAGSEAEQNRHQREAQRKENTHQLKTYYDQKIHGDLPTYLHFSESISWENPLTEESLREFEQGLSKQNPSHIQRMFFKACAKTAHAVDMSGDEKGPKSFDLNKGQENQIKLLQELVTKLNVETNPSSSEAFKACIKETHELIMDEKRQQIERESGKVLSILKKYHTNIINETDAINAICITITHPLTKIMADKSLNNTQKTIKLANLIRSKCYGTMINLSNIGINAIGGLTKDVIKKPLSASLKMGLFATNIYQFLDLMRQIQLEQNPSQRILLQNNAKIKLDSLHYNSKEMVKESIASVVTLGAMGSVMLSMGGTLPGTMIGAGILFEVSHLLHSTADFTTLLDSLWHKMMKASHHHRAHHLIRQNGITWHHNHMPPKPIEAPPTGACEQSLVRQHGMRKRPLIKSTHAAVNEPDETVIKPPRQPLKRQTRVDQSDQTFMDSLSEISDEFRTLDEKIATEENTLILQAIRRDCSLMLGNIAAMTSDEDLEGLDLNFNETLDESKEQPAMKP